MYSAEPMLDLGYVREHLDVIEKMARDRGATLDLAPFRSLDTDRRMVITSAERLKAERNKANEEIARMKKCGEDCTSLLALMKQVWSGEEFGTAGGIGPAPVRPGGPEIILGGATEASFRRVARLADGWIMGGGTPDMFADGAAAVDKAWQEAGRPGRPRKLTLAYYGLGPEARSQAEGYLLHYYGWLGDFAGQIAAGAAVSAEMVRSYVAAFEASGCDEIIFVPTSSRLDQVALLADAVA